MGLLRVFRLPRLFFRTIYSQTGVWPTQYEASNLIEIERHWTPKLKEDLRVEKSNNNNNKSYVLSMFPYPSGELHMGHVRVYTISDAMAHFYRFQGNKVLHPMGFDSFGLPAENAALHHKVSPFDWTESNILSMKKQLEGLGANFDWNCTIKTSDPSYYKWTQWIFLKLYNSGLAYRKKATVNWDPVDKTVLANEQVDARGNSWRSGAKVQRKPLVQWFIRTTQYAKDLYDGLNDSSSCENWRDIEKIQKHWIGECNGRTFHFSDNVLSVWTNRPELIFGLSFIGLKPDHELSDTKILPHPFTKEPIPILIIENPIYYPEGTNAFLGFPDMSEDIAQLCTNNSIQPKYVISSDTNCLINSEGFNGYTLKEAAIHICDYAQKHNLGGFCTSSKLQDWLISRQRYWGTPIPIIYCESCGTVPVPEKDLPVTLPKSLDSSQSGQTLSLSEHWVQTQCPNCGKPARRETDTMDTFVDSSWYFLRYLDPQNEKEPVSLEASRKWMPVDVYIGGKEHAVLHLLYARFMTRFLHDIGLVSVKEPFRRLLVQGIIQGQSYRLKGTGKYLQRLDVEVNEKEAFEKKTGLPVIVQWEKMSKSKLNGVRPQDYFEKYGSDMTRFLTLADVSPTSDRKWSEDSFVRIRNLQSRLWSLVSQAIELQTAPQSKSSSDSDVRKSQILKLWDSRNYYTKVINFNYNVTRNLAMVISRVHGLLNDLWTVQGDVKRNSSEFQHGLGTAIILLTPIAPHFCSELWSGLSSLKYKNTEAFNWDQPLLHQSWPTLDPNYNLNLVIEHNNKMISKCPIAVWKFAELDKEEALHVSYCDPIVQNLVLTKDFSSQFKKYADYEATLSFYTTVSQQEIENLQKEKMERKKIKELRKEGKKQKFVSNSCLSKDNK